MIYTSVFTGIELLKLFLLFTLDSDYLRVVNQMFLM